MQKNLLPDTDASHIAALAWATIALGCVYWLLCERDDRNTFSSACDSAE